MSDERLRRWTSARVGLQSAGFSLSTRDLLAFQLAHAGAQDAVHAPLDRVALRAELEALGLASVEVRTQAPDRAAFLRRPDWGRRLHDESRTELCSIGKKWDVVFVISDGLSAQAVQVHAPALLTELLPRLQADEWAAAPILIAEQARVALADEIGNLLGASLSIVLIGERPGLSSPDSMGIYLTWEPKGGLTDASRNCISNVRGGGLSYDEAASKLWFLMNTARTRRLSGVSLKENAPAAHLPLAATSILE